MLSFSKEIVIGGTIIREENPTFIIAEAGVNHNGDMELARCLVDAAVEAGVNAVKFQSFKTEHLILAEIEKAPYQKRTTDAGETQYEMLKRLEVSFENSIWLREYCRKKGIIFLSTPFEEKSLEELVQLDVPAFKVAATDITNIKFLRQIAETKKPIILSAGMCYLEEVKMALKAISDINNKVILLQCTANYPIRNNEANLRVLNTFRENFDILVGYSDHTAGIGASPYAVAMGAKVIEKHFTLDKGAEGPDHRTSVTPAELRTLVKEIRRVEEYLGKTVKIPTVSEQMTRKSLQKCLVASRDIEVGEIFSMENIVAKRTGGKGISALYVDEIIGIRASKKYKKDDIIEL